MQRDTASDRVTGGIRPEADWERALGVRPSASAVIFDRRGRVLLQQRSDGGQLGLPGGSVEIGESVTDAVIREVREETGIEVRVEKLLGVYSNPRHVSVYDDGEVRQQFSVCFLCHRIGGRLSTSQESSEVRFVELSASDELSIHPSIRLRIQHYVENREEPVIA